jgi:hypothetical protein
MRLRDFVRQHGKPYSEALGINLRSEPSKWFLAAILYSKPIRESSATRTYKCFEREGRTSAHKIVDAGWDELVRILDAGGYVRYDFSTATKLLRVFGNLQKIYKGDLNALHAAAADSRDLEARLKALGKGIGDITVSIFLREMRPVWAKADPAPTPLVKLAMHRLGIKDLKKFARKKRFDLVRLETALLRLAKDFYRPGKKVDIEL